MFPEIFKIAWIITLMESHFGKVTGNVYPVYSFVENAITWYVFSKSSSSRNCEKFPFNKTFRFTAYRLQRY